MEHDIPDHIEKLIEVPPEDMMGKAMLALNPRQRRFVCALAVTGGAQRKAYLWAGYEGRSVASQDAAASQLAARGDVQAAIKEEALRRLDSYGLMAVSTLGELCSPSGSAKDNIRLAAANSLLDRIGGFAGKTEHQIVIRDERTTQQILDSIKQLAKDNGLDPSKLLGVPILDAEFEEVPMSAEGLEDLL